MIQANLLQLAKQGDPEAITALMNLTLETRQVTAKVVRMGDYLHVSFSSPRSLNPDTLVSFTLKGLAELGIQSVTAVKIYGLSAGKDGPVWTKEVPINPTDQSVNPDPQTTPFTTTEQTASASSAAAFQVPDDSVGGPDSPADDLAIPAGNPKTAILGPVWESWLKTFRTWQLNQIHFATHLKSFHRNDYRTITLALASLAFLSGGALAIIASSHTQDSSKRETPESAEFVRQASSSSSKEALEMPVNDEVLRAKQQAETRKYLTKMNAAQQAFYQANQRFALNLEELERSASIISQSSSYSYKLTVYAQNRIQLVAVPKMSGLKSYTAAVFLANPTIGTMAPITTICETNKPAQVPPAMPQLIGDTAQCHAGSSRTL